MTWIEGTVALVTLALAVGLLSTALRLRRELQRTRLKYSLYASRDRLYVAAARGLVAPDSELFRHLRDVTIHTLRYADQIGSREYIRFFESADDDPGSDVSSAMVRLVQSFEALPDEGRSECRLVLVTTLNALLGLMRLNSRLARAAKNPLLAGIKKSAPEAKCARQVESGLIYLDQLKHENAATAHCM